MLLYYIILYWYSRAVYAGAKHYTPEIAEVKFHWKMPLTTDWSIPVKIHWTSDNPLENTTGQ